MKTLVRKHSQGPWSTTKDLLTPIINKDGIAILSSKINDDEVIANKKLIAAAPDLLDVTLQFKEYLISKGEEKSLIMLQVNLTLEKAL